MNTISSYDVGDYYDNIDDADYVNYYDDINDCYLN